MDTEESCSRNGASKNKPLIAWDPASPFTVIGLKLALPLMCMGNLDSLDSTVKPIC